MEAGAFESISDEKRRRLVARSEGAIVDILGPLMDVPFIEEMVPLND